MTLFEYAKEEGVKMGIEKGIEQGIEKGLKRGIQYGKVQGIELGKMEMIVNGHKIGMSVDQLSKMSELSIEKVVEILSSKG